MLSALLAVAFTFTATATGVEKGSPVEFLFAGKGTDKDYETMFVLDDSVEDLCRGIERMGVPRGRPTDARRCDLWPVGAVVRIEPSMETFIETRMPEGVRMADFVYTGGTRNSDGTVAADTNMPLSVCSLYSLAQSPIALNGIYEQGIVYGCHTAKTTLKKGERHTFKVIWEDSPLPRKVTADFAPGNLATNLVMLKDAAAKGDIEVLASFSGELTVAEATAVANALSVLDSVHVKINGFKDGQLFYRSFQPLVKWLDRTERLTQPFELTLDAQKSPRLVYIDEDWNVEGDDPKLAPREIGFADVAKYPTTDTCFIFTSPTTKLQEIYAQLKKFPATKPRNFYVFTAPRPKFT